MERAAPPIRTTLGDQPQMQDAVASFLKSGSLGPLHLGMSADRLAREVDKPDFRDFWDKAKQQPYCVWGDTTGGGYLLVNLRDGKVSAIWLYWNGSEPALPKACGHYDPCLTRRTTVDEFTSYLDRTGIKWSIHQPLTFDDQTTIESESGATCGFCHKGDEPFHGILLTARAAQQWMGAGPGR